MATGLLQNQTWNVGRAAKQCAACQTDLTPGAACWAALVGWPTGDKSERSKGDRPVEHPPYERLDFCTTCWEAGKRPLPPAELFSWWRTQIVTGEKKANPFVDDSVLLDIFNRLTDRTEVLDIRLRFVLALLLMRKRLLRYEGLAELSASQKEQFAHFTTPPEVWRMQQRGQEPETLVLNPHLTTDQISEVSQQLSGILAEELL